MNIALPSPGQILKSNYHTAPGQSAPSANPISVLIVDEDPAFPLGLESFLREDESFEKIPPRIVKTRKFQRALIKSSELTVRGASKFVRSLQSLRAHGANHEASCRSEPLLPLQRCEHSSSRPHRPLLFPKAPHLFPRICYQ